MGTIAMRNLDWTNEELSAFNRHIAALDDRIHKNVILTNIIMDI